MRREKSQKVFEKAIKKKKILDFPGSSVVKNLPVNAGDMELIPSPEDPTSHGAAKPVHYNYWACALEAESRNSRSLLTLETRL